MRTDMESKTFSARLDIRQAIVLLPAVVMGAFAVAYLIIKGSAGDTSLLLIGMAVIWLAYGIWQILGQRYILDEGGITVYSGMKRSRITYAGLKAVMLGDVAMPGSKMARGTLLLQPVNNAPSAMLYPKDMAGIIAALKEHAPDAVFLTTEEEVAAYKKMMAEKRKAAEK